MKLASVTLCQETHHFVNSSGYQIASTFRIWRTSRSRVNAIDARSLSKEVRRQVPWPGLHVPGKLATGLPNEVVGLLHSSYRR